MVQFECPRVKHPLVSFTFGTKSLCTLSHSSISWHNWYWPNPALTRVKYFYPVSKFDPGDPNQPGRIENLHPKPVTNCDQLLLPPQVHLTVSMLFLHLRRASSCAPALPETPIDREGRKEGRGGSPPTLHISGAMKFLFSFLNRSRLRKYFGGSSCNSVRGGEGGRRRTATATAAAASVSPATIFPAVITALPGNVVASTSRILFTAKGVQGIPSGLGPERELLLTLCPFPGLIQMECPVTWSWSILLYLILLILRQNKKSTGKISDWWNIDA